MSPSPRRAALIHQLVDELGLKSSDLHAARHVPTVAGYLPRVLAAATPGMVHTYRSYWLQAGDYFANRRLDDVLPSDIRAFHQHVIAAAQPRRSSRQGRHAGETALRALRNLFRLAVADGLLAAGSNPAAAVPLPRRKRSTRRGLTTTEVADINRIVLTSGNDTPLDSLLVRLHLETACRRGGALGLRLCDLDVMYCRIQLREKGGTLRWQPVSPTLTAALQAHANARGARTAGDALLRSRNHGPLSSRRYDTLWARVRRLLPWADQLGVSTHWLRHTTLTWVERNFGYAVAHSYAGHSHDKGTTLIYTRGTPLDVATALSAMTGEPHPLAHP